jgi:tetratricopeptide (TPR) repeat protein
VLGFKSVRIAGAGSSLTLTAARGGVAAPAAEPAEGCVRRYRDYLTAVQRRAPPGSALHRGCAYRLYRSYVTALDWVAATAVFDESLIAEHPKLDDLRSFAAFAQRFALCVAPMTYCRALQTLHDQADYARAARLFRAAQALCRKKMEIRPDRSVVEEELLWLAVLHEGIAYQYAGRPREAASIARAILAEESAAPEPIRERAARELA